MPVDPTEILFMGSGADNLGGVIGSQIADDSLHALFDPVTAAEAAAGYTDYRCIYIKNNSAASMLSVAVIYITNQPTATGTSISIGVTATGAVNDTEATIADETTPPAGVAFSQPSTAPTGIAMGDINFAEYRGVWIRRDIGTGAGSQVNDRFTLDVLGETA